MDKIENYYKNKFEDFEMEALPDAFDRIQQSLDADIPQGNNIKDLSTKNTWMKSTSSLMKLSISMNIILLVALPLVYYWGSNNNTKQEQFESVKQENKVIINADKNESKPQVDNNSLNIPSEDNNIKNSATSNKTKGNSAIVINIPADKNDISQVVDTKTNNPSLTKESIPENKTNEEAKVTDQKNNVTANTRPKNKNNLDAYYDDNVNKLKDSTGLLFKKKK